ncbi:unnamed protein product [Rotaria socialis]|uniref:ADP ribosyltransferase domain-containing protein n=1 Tax=Rotaria socialis TaxID=392032 RepID=A0A817TH51_9BILA|nr:unnamed protein product [Rotaria socialis]CAF3312795.1 unnamed protein product [Rotaria socialis]CAF3727244.1 unnamed protein product [Rotaria socialis]CAF4429153.1 unnamed protein product [Rotaria socialis]CAF4562786.1 unnamed protein product [Rotaria socialis]
MALRLNSTDLNLDPDYITVNMEDFQFVWLDSKFAKTTFSPNALRYRQLILELNSAAQLFSNPLKCVDFMRVVKKERLFLIVSGSLAEKTISNIHEYYPLSAIFIFCTHPDHYTHLLDRFNKLKGIFDDQESLLDSIRRNMKHVEYEMLSINAFDWHHQRTVIDLSKKNASFLWHQLLLKVLQAIPHSKEEREEFLKKLQEYYQGNPQQMAKIHQFRIQYRQNLAIEWYTEESFLYRLVNKAFRTKDIDYLYSLRFFINDLCSELVLEKTKLNDIHTLTLYRGQLIPKRQIKELQNSEGKLISTNGFFSTSRAVSVACGHVGIGSNSSSIKADQVRVLFEIHVDPRKHVILADIATRSRFPTEREVLFAPNSTFKVNSTEFNEVNNLLTIKMTATDDGEYQLQRYMGSQLHYLRDCPPVVYFGRILFEKLGRPNRAEKYFQMLLKIARTNNEEEAAIIHIQLGDLHSMQKRPKKAIDYYRKAQELYYKRQSTPYAQIISCLLKIGNEYLSTSELSQVQYCIHSCFSREVTQNKKLQRNYRQ